MSQTPEERREAQIDAMASWHYYDRSDKDAPLVRRRAAPYLDRLLGHLDEHSPLAAQLVREGDESLTQEQRDVMKYGLTDSGLKHYRRNEVDGDVWFIDADFGDLVSPLFRINYPDGHPKQ